MCFMDDFVCSASVIIDKRKLSKKRRKKERKSIFSLLNICYASLVQNVKKYYSKKVSSWSQIAWRMSFMVNESTRKITIGPG